MPSRIAVNTLQASTVDILNVIRANASAEYQTMVPELATATDIPRVGEILYGYPALANQFIASLMNRIALVRVRSATFNNRFAPLKKGYLDYGEVVEEVFVEMVKAREFSADKAASREFKRTLPDVRTAMHAMNWQVQYPITIQQNELRQAFTSESGVRDLVGKITANILKAADYDEYLLFKYLMIKAISHGKMYPHSIGDGSMRDAAVAFRGVSNDLGFVKTKYNHAGVHTNTEKNDQYIFMDSMYNAAYDVDVLASAFNMDKATFSGRLILIDDWTSFDNDRFEEIRKNSSQLEEVTADELALLSNVKAVLCDGEWFQVYDNLTVMTEVFVASGMYWNYFYNVWKTVSSSPFSNAVVFVTGDANIALPASIKVSVTSVDKSADATVLTLSPEDVKTVSSRAIEFVQTDGATKASVAVHRFGAVIFPSAGGSITLVAKIGNTEYTATAAITQNSAVGSSFTLNKAEE